MQRPSDNQPVLPTPQQRRGMRNAIITQCFGTLGQLAFTNGLILVYLTAKGISSARIVLYLSLFSLMDMLFRVPSAFFADRYGKKLVGMLGILCNVLGYAILVISGSCAPPLSNYLIVLGIMIYSIGNAVMTSSWFALLSPIVPLHLRGRFFGTLRLSWQSVGFVFALAYTFLLARDSSLQAYQIILSAITVSLIIRSFFYSRLPELERPAPSTAGPISLLAYILRTPGYLSLCSYLFLLALFTGACVTIFGLIEKRVLLMSDGQVVWLGTMTMVGSVIGFTLAGRLVDRLGTKPIFVVCHLAYGIVITGFMARGALPDIIFITLCVLHLQFGMISAATSVATSTEILAIIPPENKSLSTSVGYTLYIAGGAFAGLISSWVLEHDLLNDRWQLGRLVMSQYDSILLACATMIVLLVITLGLLPSVAKRPPVPAAEGELRDSLPVS